jgi:hypothetical protein
MRDEIGFVYVLAFEFLVEYRLRSVPVFIAHVGAAGGLRKFRVKKMVLAAGFILWRVSRRERNLDLTSFE